MSRVSVNIGGDPNDRFYRYKRDVLQIKSEHKHGVQTRLLNLFAVAKQLHVDVKDLAAAIRKRLGLNLTVDRDAEQCVIQGQVAVEQLEDAVERYIAQNVLCRKCGLPELRHDRCLACGHAIGAISTKSASSSTAPELRQTINDLVEVAGVKFSHTEEATCCQTLNEMLDWHDTHRHHPMYTSHCEAKLDSLRACCWECTSDPTARRKRRQWLKLKLAFEQDLGMSLRSP